MSRADELLDKYIAEAALYEQEEHVLDEMAKGWDKSSAEKFGKTIGVSPSEHGFMAACIARMKKHDMKDPGGFCAEMVDRVKGTTQWRSGPRKKKDDK